MREILYRGKSVATGEWFEGSLVHRTKFYGDPTDKYYIIYNGEFHGDYYNSVEVIPETIGQFTGSLDRNGKKIFEGDIVNARNSLNGLYYLYIVINWRDSILYCNYEYKDNDESEIYGSYISNYSQDDTEILGNIHDIKTLDVDTYLERLSALKNDYGKKRGELNENFVKILKGV